MRTAETIERDKSAASSQPENSKPIRKKGLPKGCEPYKFKPGQSGNPGGRPKNDLAKEIARAVFEGDAGAIAAAFTKVLRKGNAYAFKELADRAYGKVTDKLEVTDAQALVDRLAGARKRLGESK